MRRVNRECIVCGKHYEYCSGCAGSDPTWKTIYCCEDCREISHILSDYHGDLLSLEDAKLRLEKCDQSKIEKLDKVSQAIAHEILNILPIKEQSVVLEQKNVTPIQPRQNYNNKKNKNKKRK